MRYFILMILFILTSCLKTTDQIKQEKVVKALPNQIQQSQKTIANMTLRINHLENKLQSYNGNIEELEYQQNQVIPKSQKEMMAKLKTQEGEISLLRNSIKKNNKELTSLKSKFQEQSSYLKKVTSMLTSLSKKKVSRSQSKNKKQSSYQQGLNSFQKKHYQEAKKNLLYALKNEKLNAAEKNKLYQTLGHIEFSQKKYRQSSVYFSKIFTKYPKSSMAPDALLHMARAFKKQKQISAAKEAYKTFIKKYPKDKLFKVVKKELNAL